SLSHSLFDRLGIVTSWPAVAQSALRGLGLHSISDASFPEALSGIATLCTISATPCTFLSTDGCLHRAVKCPHLMEFKDVLSQFIYRIEARPGGGFIGTSRDPAATPIEGATREEGQKKIQERIAAAMATQFPEIRPALERSNVHLHYHIEPKAGGGYTIHHGNPASTISAHAAEGSMLEHLENLIESQIFSAIVNHLPPETRSEMEQKINSGGIDVEMDRTVSVTTKSGSLFALGSARDAATPQASSDSSAFASPLSPSSNQTPIVRYDIDTPVKYEKSGGALRFLLALAIIALLVFLYLHRG